MIWELGNNEKDLKREGKDQWRNMGYTWIHKNLIWQQWK